MTDAKLFQFVDRFLRGRVEPDDFKALIVADTRHLSYLLKQRQSWSQAQYEAAQAACLKAPPAGPSLERGHLEQDILAELGFE